MTIAACFKFDEGILFCADTKIAREIKTTQTKIVERIYEGNYCATTFVLTGAIPYAKAAIENCEHGIAQLDFIKASMQDVRKVIESCLTEFYQSHVFPHPNRENVDFQLLVGIWLKGETCMFSSFETTVSTVKDYECLGTGSYLALYWIRQFFASQNGWETKTRTLQDVALISAYALKSVMNYDEYCGGEAEFLIMRNNGQFGYEVDTAIPLHPCEEFPDQILKIMWRMMRKLTLAEHKYEADWAVEEFQDAVGKVAEKRGQWIDMITSSLKQSIAEPKADSPVEGVPD